MTPAKPQPKRTCVGVATPLRNAVRVIAAHRGSTISAEVASALQAHITEFVTANPDLATQVTSLTRSASKPRQPRR